MLDDPLSAVDLKVGKHIFERCFKELLGDKTRVLTSHQEQHMKEADEVIVLYKGSVLGKGSFTELQGNGILSTTVDPLYKKVMLENGSKRKRTKKNRKSLRAVVEWFHWPVKPVALKYGKKIAQLEWCHLSFTGTT